MWLDARWLKEPVRAPKPQTILNRNLPDRFEHIWYLHSFNLSAQEQDIDNPTDVNLALEIRDGGKKYLRQFRFNAESCVTLHIYFDAIFALIAPNGSTLTSPVWPDEMFHIYFPGDYTVCSGGVLEADVPKQTWKPATISRQPSVVGGTSSAPSRDEFFDPSIDAGLVYPEAMVLGPNSMMDLLDSPAPTTPSRASASASASASPSRTPSASASATPKKGLSRSSSFSARRRKRSPTAKATSDESRLHQVANRFLASWPFVARHRRIPLQVAVSGGGASGRGEGCPAGAPLRRRAQGPLSKPSQRLQRATREAGLLGFGNITT